MILAHRIRLDLNNIQRTWFERCAGAARFVFNWGLERWRAIHQSGGNPSWHVLNAELNAKKAAAFSWLRQIPWKVANQALVDLGKAFSKFFQRTSGYPRFKKKGRCREGFAIEGRALQFDGHKVKIPKLGWVRTREALRFPGKILSARFTKRADHWYVSLHIEVDETRWVYPHRCETQAAVGVDLGVQDLAVLSTGERIAAPRSLRKHEAKLRRLNKELSRRKRGGVNWRRTKLKLAKLHERIANVRRDVIHRLTASIVRCFRWIGVEDLNVAGMMRSRLAKSVADASMSEVVRQLRYKAPLAGGTIVQADRFFPSSKTCSVCESIYAGLTLDERRWRCSACSSEHDRDVNAAKNLQDLAEAYSVTAYRQGSAGIGQHDAKLPFG